MTFRAGQGEELSVLWCRSQTSEECVKRNKSGGTDRARRAWPVISDITNKINVHWRKKGGKHVKLCRPCSRGPAGVRRQKTGQDTPAPNR